MRMRGTKKKGFTLIEMVVVVFIIALLVSLLIVAIMSVVGRGGDAQTMALFEKFQDAMTEWREGEGKGNNTFPISGTNSTSKKNRYEGNRMLFNALITNPEKKGRNPYIELEDEQIGYIDKDGNLVDSGSDDQRVFLDGHGTPIVYWEWASKTRSSNRKDLTEGGSSKRVSKKELELATNKKTFDMYSAGEDTLWGTNDDVASGSGAVSKAENPFPDESGEGDDDDDDSPNE